MYGSRPSTAAAAPGQLEKSQSPTPAVPAEVPLCLRRLYVIAERHVPALNPQYRPSMRWVKIHKAATLSGTAYSTLLGAVLAMTAVSRYALASTTMAALLAADLGLGLWIFMSANMAWRATTQARPATSDDMYYYSDALAKFIAIPASCGLLGLLTLELVGQDEVAVATATVCLKVCLILLFGNLIESFERWDGL